MPTNSTERKPANSNLAGAPAKTLRVLHVINGEHYSGAERVQDLLGLGLPEQGIEVGFACVKPGKFEISRQSTNCPLYDTSMKSRMDMRAAWRLAKIIRQQQYEIVHAHTPRSLMIGRVAAALASVPVVYHVHSPTSRDTTHSLRNWLNSASERFSLSGVSRLVCVSQSLADHMRACGYREELIRVVPNGVPSGPELTARETPSGTWTLSMVALFRPRKGLEVLLHALAELRAQQVPVRLRAIGPFETPEYEATIRELVAELGLEDAIDWIGFTREVNRELAQTDLFVLPSLFGEGLPMVVLEAMAAGVPVIGTAIEGIPEAIRDGVDGLIAAPSDAASLASAIRRVIEGEVDWQALRASARLRQVALFSDHSMATGVAQVYRELLA
jgi:glycosyltransferase involved in cell wall biosynthesis